MVVGWSRLGVIWCMRVTHDCPHRTEDTIVKGGMNIACEESTVKRSLPESSKWLVNQGEGYRTDNICFNAAKTIVANRGLGM